MRKLTYAIFDLNTGKTIRGPIDATDRIGAFSARRWGRALLAVWWVVRLPVLMLLVVLEPAITFLFGGLALLGTLATIFFTVIHAPHFPAWTMLSLSLGFMLTLVLYEGLIRVLSN